MKLYYWDEVYALNSYIAGQAIAHARTKQIAIEAIVNSVHWGLREDLQKELEQTEPKVIEATKIFGIGLLGSD